MCQLIYFLILLPIFISVFLALQTTTVITCAMFRCGQIMLCLLRCVSLSVASVRFQQIYLSSSSAPSGVSVLFSYGMKLLPSVFQQDFLMNLFSCITMPSFLIQLLLKVLQPVVIRCLVAPSESHPLHRVMENTILLGAVICFVKLSGAFCVSVMRRELVI
jgi:hypothetical protein